MAQAASALGVYGSRQRKVGDPVLSKSLNKNFPALPDDASVADYRARNLLILRVPATARVPVTSEVASSSLVVPAIFFSDFLGSR